MLLCWSTAYERCNHTHSHIHVSVCVCVRCCQGDGQMAGSMNVFARVSRLRLSGTFTLERKSSFKGSNMWRKPQAHEAHHLTAAQHLHPVNVYHRSILLDQRFDGKHITLCVICITAHRVKHDEVLKCAVSRDLCWTSGSVVRCRISPLSSRRCTAAVCLQELERRRQKCEFLHPEAVRVFFFFVGDVNTHMYPDTCIHYKNAHKKKKNYTKPISVQILYMKMKPIKNEFCSL